MADASSPRPFKPEDLFHLVLLQSARFSPDGKSVVYAASHVEKGEDATEEEERISLWLLSLVDGQVRRLTAGLSRDSAPSWSPDGTAIAFLSTRSGKPQIHLLPVDGGEARALTSLAQGVGGGPVWSPDGRHIAFTASSVRDKSRQDGPYKVARHVYRMDALGYLDDVVQDLYVVPSGGGNPIRLTSDGWHYTMPHWSPGGNEILILASMSPTSHEAWLGRARLVDLHGRARDVTGEWGEVVSAAWTPDGEWIVLCGKPRDRKIGSKYDLWVVDKDGGAPECRTGGLTLGVGGSLIPDMAALLDQVFVPNILIGKDGGSAFVRVQDGGTVPIYRISLSGPESWLPLVSGEQSCFLEDLHEGYLLYASSDLFNPADLFLLDLEGGNTARLTQLNASLLSRRELASVHHLNFAGGEGTPVEGWILEPRLGKPPYPTILYIHGGPHNGFGHIFCFDFLMLAAAGYAVLFINHRGSTGYGDEFANQILGDWGNLDYRDLMAAVDHVIDKGLADPDRLGCYGLSGGGNLSCWIVGQTDRFKAAVPENPVTNWVSFYGVSNIGVDFAVKELGGHPHEIPDVYRRCSPITYAHRCATPTLLIQGEADFRCPAEQSEQFYTVLKANGCVVEMLRFPASSHAETAEGRLVIRRAQNEALLSWMNKYVLGMTTEEVYPT